MSRASKVACFGLAFPHQLAVVRITLPDNDVAFHVDLELLVLGLDDSFAGAGGDSLRDQITIRSADSSTMPIGLPPIRWSSPSMRTLTPPVMIVTCSGGVRLGGAGWSWRNRCRCAGGI